MAWERVINIEYQTDSDAQIVTKCSNADTTSAKNCIWFITTGVLINCSYVGKNQTTVSPETAYIQDT